MFFSSSLIAHMLKFCSDKKKASHIFQTACDNSFAMKVPKQVGNEISIISTLWINDTMATIRLKALELWQ